MNTAQTAALFGVSVRQLQYWAESGLVSPKLRGRSQDKSVQNGKSRVYGSLDLLKLGVAACLRAKGMPLRDVHRVLKRINGRESYLVADEEVTARLQSHSAALELACGWRGAVYLIDLGAIRAAIQRRKSKSEGNGAQK